MSLQDNPKVKLFLLPKDSLSDLFELIKKHYLIVGLTLRNGVPLYERIQFEDIPRGYRDVQSPGFYKVEEGSNRVFSITNGPDSPKRILHRPLERLFHIQKTKTTSSLIPLEEGEQPICLFGIRPCDLEAIRRLDRVFQRSSLPVYTYNKRRALLFTVVVNCTEPGRNCFCLSTGTGPFLISNYDIQITENERDFLIQAGSKKAREIVEGLSLKEADPEQREKLYRQAIEKIRKNINTKGLPQKLYAKVGDASLWEEIEQRCLACANCTQVCPTCFCSSQFDYIDLSGIGNKGEIEAFRTRKWDTCFSANFARVHGGNFRPSVWARYRHWLTHKLGYWIEEFGNLGCVGCGRCITWCPVGIDITEEFKRVTGHDV